MASSNTQTSVCGHASIGAVFVWVTPNVHKIHHSRQVSETNSNYANLLTVYDRLLADVHASRSAPVR